MLISAEIYKNFHREVGENLFKKPEYFDLTDCFKDIQQDVYVDDGHTNRYGNYLIADRISEAVHQNFLHKNSPVSPI